MEPYKIPFAFATVSVDAKLARCYPNIKDQRVVQFSYVWINKSITNWSPPCSESKYYFEGSWHSIKRVWTKYV